MLLDDGSFMLSWMFSVILKLWLHYTLYSSQKHDMVFIFTLIAIYSQVLLISISTVLPIPYVLNTPTSKSYVNWQIVFLILLFKQWVSLILVSAEMKTQ